MEISFLVFLTNLEIICFTRSRFISFLLSVDWASRDIRAPSSSLILELMCEAIYSITSSGIWIPSLYVFFRRIAILVSKSGVCKSADSPHLNRDSRRCSNPCSSTGGLSDVRISCFPVWCRWLKIWKKVSCVFSFPAKSWVIIMIWHLLVVYTLLEDGIWMESRHIGFDINIQVL